MSRRRRRSDPLDRWVIGIWLVGILMLGMLWGISHYSPPHLRQFSGQDQRVDALTSQLVFRFNRLMNTPSVEANLRFDPPLAGRFNWRGRQLFYSLVEPAVYGQSYQVSLSGATDLQGRAMRDPFEAKFTTPDPQVVLIGLSDPVLSKLVLLNLKTRQQKVVSPAGLQVTEVQPTQDGDPIYYFATETTVQNQSLYGLSLATNQSQKLIDSSLQNLRLQQSADGQLTIVERIRPPSDIQLWVKRADQKSFNPLKLNTLVGGDFLISPDNGSLIVAQGQGLSIVPIEPGAKPIDFLAEYGQAIAIKPDGSQAALVTFNQDYTRTLWMVDNTGGRIKLATILGSVLSGQFSPTDTVFYALTTRLDPKTYTESPELIAFNWRTQAQKTLLKADFPKELDFSIAPDGRTLVYSVLQPALTAAKTKAPLSRSGQILASGQSWQVRIRGIELEGAADPLPVSGVGLAWVP